MLQREEGGGLKWGYQGEGWDGRMKEAGSRILEKVQLLSN